VRRSRVDAESGSQLGRRLPRRPTRPLRHYLHPIAAPAALLALRHATNDGIPPSSEDHSMGTLKDELTSKVGAYDGRAVAG